MTKDFEVIVLDDDAPEVPEFQYQLIEWKDPERTGLLYESEIFDDLIQACNHMHHTLHKQKGYVEIRRIENSVMRIPEGETIESKAEEIMAWLEKQGSTNH